MPVSPAVTVISLASLGLHRMGTDPRVSLTLSCPHCDNLGAEACSRVLIVHSKWPVLFQTALPVAHTRVQFQPESSKGKSLDSQEEGSELSSSLLGFWSPHPPICGAHVVLVHPVDKVSAASKETRESSHSGLEGGFLFFSRNHAKQNTFACNF